MPEMWKVVAQDNNLSMRFAGYPEPTSGQHVLQAVPHQREPVTSFLEVPQIGLPSLDTETPSVVLGSIYCTPQAPQSEGNQL